MRGLGPQMERGSCAVLFAERRARSQSGTTKSTVKVELVEILSSMTAGNLTATVSFFVACTQTINMLNMTNQQSDPSPSA